MFVKVGLVTGEERRRWCRDRRSWNAARCAPSIVTPEGRVALRQVRPGHARATA
jgi:hypothetical protein